MQDGNPDFGRLEPLKVVQCQLKSVATVIYIIDQQDLQSLYIDMQWFGQQCLPGFLCPTQIMGDTNAGQVVMIEMVAQQSCRNVTPASDGDDDIRFVMVSPYPFRETGCEADDFRPGYQFGSEYLIMHALSVGFARKGVVFCSDKLSMPFIGLRSS